jgi:hypothetical protein
MDYTINTPFQYKKEQIKFKSIAYKSNEEFEKEILELKNEKHMINPILKEYTSIYIEPLFQKKHMYKEETFNKKEYGELDFYNWLKKQKDPSIAVLAEIVNAPKMNKEIEEFRPNVKDLDTITIDDYIKIKKWGSRKSEWLKQMKKKYGNYILKFLKLSITQ